MTTQVHRSIPPLVASSVLIEMISRRATYKGMQYVVADIYSSEVVTIHDRRISCTCGMDAYGITCQHILFVESRERAYTEEASRRATYTDVFAIYN